MNLNFPGPFYSLKFNIFFLTIFSLQIISCLKLDLYKENNVPEKQLSDGEFSCRADLPYRDRMNFRIVGDSIWGDFYLPNAVLKGAPLSGPYIIPPDIQFHSRGKFKGLHGIYNRNFIIDGHFDLFVVVNHYDTLPFAGYFTEDTYYIPSIQKTEDSIILEIDSILGEYQYVGHGGIINNIFLPIEKMIYGPEISLKWYELKELTNKKTKDDTLYSVPIKNGWGDVKGDLNSEFRIRETDLFEKFWIRCRKDSLP